MATERLSYLFGRYTAGEASPTEQEELWAILRDLSAAEETVEALDSRLTALWEEQTQDTLQLEPQWQRTMVQIRRQIILAGRHPSDKRLRRLFPVAAAATILLALLSWWLLNIRRHTAPADVAPGVVRSAHDVPPGHAGALLTLSDGSTLVLDSLSDGAIATQGNTQLTKHDGQLLYTKEGKATADLRNTLTTPRGRQFRLTLPDGTQVWLNAASSISYSVAFNGSDRRIQLTGEGYFEVAQDMAKPFIVEVKGLQIKVLGTHFNVMAYEDEAALRATLLEGRIAVSGQGKEHTVNPGEQLSVSGEGRNWDLQQVDVQQTIAWKNGYFVFERADLATVMRQLARWYDIDVHFDGGARRLFGGEMKMDMPLSGVLRLFEKGGIHFSRNGNQITIKE